MMVSADYRWITHENYWKKKRTGYYFNKIREILNFENYNSADMPEGTICTVPYYSDILVPVKKKS